MRLLLLTAATGLLTLSGAVHGLRTDRWKTSPDLELAVARLQHIPDTVGDWQGQTPEALDPRHVEEARLSGYLVRRYENRHNGGSVSVMLVCGRPGPIAVHPPDICYRGAGFQVAGEKRMQMIEAGPDRPPAEFWTASFSKPDPAHTRHLRLYWAWGSQGTWSVPDNPRLTFAAQSALYKLYVIHQPTRDDDPAEEAVPVQFLRTLLPELETALFAPS